MKVANGDNVSLECRVSRNSGSTTGVVNVMSRNKEVYSQKGDGRE